MTPREILIERLGNWLDISDDLLEHEVTIGALNILREKLPLLPYVNLQSKLLSNLLDTEGEVERILDQQGKKYLTRADILFLVVALEKETNDGKDRIYKSIINNWKHYDETRRISGFDSPGG